MHNNKMSQSKVAYRKQQKRQKLSNIEKRFRDRKAI